jgi:pyruvate dehydrogenase E1 component beta subunit
MITTLTYREALGAALARALDEDERVFIMGEDVGKYGGTYAVTQGMLETYGPERIRDTPLSESGFVGAGIGAALGGMRPIIEVMTVNFSLLALDQIVNNAATLSHMSGGQFNVPVVIRMATGSGRQLAAQHSHSWEGWYAHIPGIRILTPSTPADAYTAVRGALRDPNPVLIFEHVMLYATKGEVDTEAPCTEADLYKSVIRRSGTDLTMITYGGTTPKVLQAAEELAGKGISAEVIDLRSLRPLDEDTILNSVAHTNRLLVVEEAWRTGSISAEICSRVAEKAFYHLEAAPQRLCGQEVPIPYAKHLEDAAVPQVSTIVSAAQEVVSP